MKSTLVLGLGNLLQGDDGVGCRAIQALEKQALPEDVEVMEGGTPGLGLVDLWQDRRRVILIDAADMGRAPGEVVRFSAEQILQPPGAILSLHACRVGDALALSRALNLSLPEIVVLGVQPARIEWSENLSLPVRAGLDRVIEAVLEEVGAYHGERKNPDH